MARSMALGTAKDPEESEGQNGEQRRKQATPATSENLILWGFESAAPGLDAA